MTNAKKGWIVVALFVVLLGVGLFARSQEKNKQISVAMQKIEEETGNVKRIKQTCQKMLDTDKTDYISPNLNKKKLEDTGKAIQTVNQSIEKLPDIKDKNFQIRRNALKEEYQSTMQLYTNISVRSEDQSEINQLFIPKTATIKKGNKLKIKESDVANVPVEALAVTRSKTGDTLLKQYAMNGKYINRELAIIDDLTEETMNKILKTNKNKSKSYQSSGEWEKSKDQLIDEAQKQMKHIASTKTTIQNVLKEDKESKSKEEQMAQYEATKKEVEKIKNAKARKGLQKELQKILKDIETRNEEIPKPNENVEDETNNALQNEPEEDEEIPRNTGNYPPSRPQGSPVPVAPPVTQQPEAPIDNEEVPDEGIEEEKPNNSGSGEEKPPVEGNEEE